MNVSTKVNLFMKEREFITSYWRRSQAKNCQICTYRKFIGMWSNFLGRKDFHFQLKCQFVFIILECRIRNKWHRKICLQGNIWSEAEATQKKVERKCVRIRIASGPSNTLLISFCFFPPRIWRKFFFRLFTLCVSHVLSSQSFLLVT